MNFDDFDLVYAYTRTQAIADGVLIPISEEESGLKIPAVVSSNLFHHYIEPPEKLVGEGQSTTGRLHDTIMMFKAAASVRWDGTRVAFDVLYLMGPGRLEKVKILGLLCTDDKEKACLTFCLPEDE
ncbi:hypothetical protein SAMN02745704_00096 [Paucidesulfovibrio gracilis DSM 16080]|uniref:Uncharacterized protein n=1 Tax=Paucidesulfovibrio gracilis DSM 16080 TaxID=1121449 RepID=A0A1T4W241_9BACT|nr:DUF6573 family protein [Paucidesulfovibrio gracilis]SKA71209.1 hypothetical protein SAMN02745704_00096 [Paucidesulfovibrio gracilis DSM 16080]